MIRTKSLLHGLTCAAVMIACVTSVVFAEVSIEWATVGNPGNAEDPLNAWAIPGIGSVAEVYRVGKYEVTNDQYAEFLNAVAATDANGLYNTEMGTDPVGGIVRNGLSGSFSYTAKANMGNKPVIYVSFLDAMRFVNWLQNGQPIGAQDASTTEAGVYAISDGSSETRAAGALFFIPTQNEWYKAAYHEPAADTDDYWRYPTRSNGAPTAATADANGNISNPGVNVANHSFGADWNGQDGNLTTVGSAGPLSESFYGTSDQAGNVFEWNETIEFGSSRGLHGGAWSFSQNSLESAAFFTTFPAFESSAVGFRVAAGPGASTGVPVPDHEERAPSLTVSPNPIRDHAQIRFAVPGEILNRAHIYDIQGERVRTLLAGSNATDHLVWDRRDDVGRIVPDGVYFLQVETSEGRILATKLALVR